MSEKGKTKEPFVINLSTYNSPEIVESQREEWVGYGADNDYYDYLIDLYRDSPTNNACVFGTAQLIYGQGITAKDAARKLEDYARFKSMVPDTEIRKMCLDLKMFGSCAVQGVKNAAGTKTLKTYHFPMNKLRPKKANDKGEIEAYFYSDDWSDTKKNPPKEIPTMGNEKGGNEWIYIIRPYSVGSFYFAQPDYQGGTTYAELEINIGEFHINNILNGFMPSALINFNNGVPDKEEQKETEQRVINKWTGAENAGKIVVAFNDSKENAATVESFALQDAGAQYEFLSGESQRKIIVAHRVTSPMLLGIKDNTGLGNNADELRTAYILFKNTVVKPFQQIMLEGLKQINEYEGISLDIEFINLTSDEMTTDAVPNTTQETRLSSQAEELSQEEERAWIEHLKNAGEMMDDYEIVQVTEVDDPVKELAFELELQGEYADPAAKSAKGDSGLYKVRYRYSRNLSKDSRNFCREMVKLSKSNLVFKREDITRMSREGVNGQFAPEGKKSYSIWLYKGGVYCHHKWERVVFKRKRKDGRFLPKSTTDKMENDAKISVSRAKSDGVPNDKLTPKQWKAANTAPINTPSRGSLKNK